MKSRIKFLLVKILQPTYKMALIFLHPINNLLVLLRRYRIYNNSVLHISYMVHVPYYTTRILRKVGLKADYLAIDQSSIWEKCDYQAPDSKIPIIKALFEFLFFWKVVAKYEIVHLHFALTMSSNGWELSFLKRLGRKIVIHYRGCEIRDYNINIKLHPDVNICQDCDYDHICLSKENISRINRVAQYGDVFLVTTPDMKDFVPQAQYIPFFCIEEIINNSNNVQLRYPKVPLRLLHWTVHPGIEGTAKIEKVIKSLQNKGYLIEFIFLKWVSHPTVMKEIAKADLTIGKMKMGYYANSQIEAMASGVPTITWVRPEFMTDNLRNSGFIFSHLDDLEKTLQYYLDNPEKIEEKRKIARESILRLHDNITLANKYKDLYRVLYSK